MMKKMVLAFLSLIMLLSFAVAADGDVVLQPNSITADTAVTAMIEGYESTTFDYYWVRDGATYYTSTGSSSTLTANYLEYGQEWTVSVWVPESAWFDSYEYNSASFTVAASESEEEEVPTFPGGEVVIEGYCADEDLTGYVSGYEGTSFEFYWMRGSTVYSSNTGTSSTLEASETFPRQTWTLSVWVPASSWYDSFEYGSEQVTVQNCNGFIPGDGGEAPQATDIHFSLEEGEYVDVDVVYVNSLRTFQFFKAYTSTVESKTVYVYDADSDEEDLSYSFSSPLNSKGQWQTTGGDAGVYTSTFTVTDENSNTGTSDVRITVGDAGENTCPTVKAKDLTVTEGDLAVADYVVNDVDGDAVTVTFGAPFSAFGLWQTVEGDAGVYKVRITVDDGGCIQSILFQVTVLVDGDNDHNEAPEIKDIPDVVIDEGETIVVEAEARDPDGDDIYFTFDGLQHKGAGAEDNVLTWATDCGDAGLYTVTATVSDGRHTDSTTFTVYVRDVCDLDTVRPGPSNYEGGKLSVSNALPLNADALYSGTNGVSLKGLDDTIVFWLEMYNKNSFDAEDIQVTFTFAGEQFVTTFNDLDRSEKDGQLYYIAIPENLKAGSYPLHVRVSNDAIEETFVYNLDIVSVSDFDTNTKQGFWAWLIGLFF